MPSQSQSLSASPFSVGETVNLPGEMLTRDVRALMSRSITSHFTRFVTHAGMNGAFSSQLFLGRQVVFFALLVATFYFIELESIHDTHVGTHLFNETPIFQRSCT